MQTERTSTQSQWMERESRALFSTYKRYPVVAERGQGCRLWDVDGRSYLDFLGGLAVDALGHAPKAIADAVAQQAATLIQTSNLIYTLPQIELAEYLVDHSCLDRVFFCNSGTEANEAAFKLARKWGKVHKGGAHRIIAAENSFHGRTLGALAATWTEAYRKPFEPMIPGFDFVPFDNVDALADAVTDDVVAVVLEPIQAEGGLYPPGDSYLPEVRQICDERNVLLIFDEVQTGIGRTGKRWAYEHWNVEPDIMTLAKGLAGGFPIGAMLAKERCAAFEPGDHGTTFGGNPLACAVALAVQREIDAQNLIEHVAVVGRYFRERLLDLQQEQALIKDVRGRGLLIGVELTQEVARTALDGLRERGLIANALSGRTLRFIPPLIVSQEEIDEAVEILRATLQAL